ncbi:LytR/AlgR family response regulator transcription factor [Flavobacteriaceae bacterium 14752]|uniref:LytR/AlgR family response regulator transcription factor n=1 Tax=Mesohalobacter salilacus TaxID=2491711 RepID=UPI000F632921|nr:DNA-binding response regulator [Flavobacteriaceae bacterium 14752]
MTAIIIEDEKPAARRLLKLLSDYDINILETLHSLSEAEHWLGHHRHPDLIFLDIQLSDGLSFELFNNRKIDSAIIFTTAYDEYALKAFKVNSIDYLLKPIDKEELKAAIQKYKSQQKHSNINFEDLKAMFGNTYEEQQYKERFTVKVGEHLKVFETNEINCFLSQHKTSYLLTKNGRQYPLEKSLEEIDSLLSPKYFFRINRAYIIHINAIKDIISYSNSRLRIVLRQDIDEPLIVSRERVKDFKQWLDG